MKPSHITLVLFVAAIFVALLGTFLENDIILLMAKPIIAPSIYFYYLQTSSKKISWLFSMIFFLNFIDDIITLLEIENGMRYIIVLNGITITILLYFRFRDMRIIEISTRAVLYIILAVITNCVLLFVMLHLIVIPDPFLLNISYIYSFILWLLVCISAFQFYSHNDLKNTYAAIMCGCLILSNIGYGLYNFYLNMPIFILINVLMHSFSYLYIVKYFTAEVTHNLDIDDN
jgi:hypothetical protein